jgi:hemoglobin
MPCLGTTRGDRSETIIIAMSRSRHGRRPFARQSSIEGSAYIQRMEVKTPTLYEWVGGLDRIEALFGAFYEKVPADAVLGPVFAQMSKDHFHVVAHFVAEVLGGPKLYSGDGLHSHSSMVAKHIGRHLTNEQRKRWVSLLLDTADELNLPEDPEFRSALVGYLEWGSRLAVINSTTTENPIGSDAPMPKWGWGEVKGPYTPD